MDFDKLDIAISLCLYLPNNDAVMKELIEEEGLTPERAYILMCAALVHISWGSNLERDRING